MGALFLGSNFLFIIIPLKLAFLKMPNLSDSGSVVADSRTTAQSYFLRVHIKCLIQLNVYLEQIVIINFQPNLGVNVTKLFFSET